MFFHEVPIKLNNNFCTGLPNNLKDLQKVCKERSLKFKGNSKAQLKELLLIELFL